MIQRVLMLIVIGSLVASWPAISCSCVTGTLKGDLEGSYAVFVGKVTRVEILHSDGVIDLIRAIRDPLRPGESVTARAVLEPLEVVKGTLPKEVEFVTDNGCCDCSFWFDVGETYLIFARGNGGNLTTSACSRSGRLIDVTDDLKALGLERFLTNHH
jgi:hypothetical protein